MPELLTAPLTVKHVLPGGGTVYHSGPKVAVVAPENAAAYVTCEVAPDDVRECHGGQVFIMNATGTTIETLNLS
jgi:hypothetical protein